MISRTEAEELLQKDYYTDNFVYLVSEVLFSDFKADKHEVIFSNSLFTEIIQLGISKDCDVTIYEVGLVKGTEKRRVAITQEMFRVLRGQGINNALVAFYNADKRNYRISLLTSKYEFDGDKIVKILSNPRRFSYTLGYNTKTHTAYKYLIAGGHVNNLEDLISRFSVEVVNKQFYSEIANCFSELVGGEREGKTFHRQLNLYGVTDQNKYSEFAVRLIKLEGSAGSYQMSLFEDQEHIKKLQEVRELYFRVEDADEKKDLKDEFKDIQQAMLLTTISNYDKQASKLYQSLSEWKPFKRADKGDTPYNLRNCVYLDDFSKQKIVWKRIGSKIRFCYDDSGLLCLDSTCFATGIHIKKTLHSLTRCRKIRLKTLLRSMWK